MKQIYFNILIVIFAGLGLTSCSTTYNFKTKGLPETESSYLINKKGERITATKIVVKKKILIVDGQKMKMDSFTAIKSKKMYFVINDDKLFMTEMYGKINLLYTLSYSYSYAPRNYSSSMNNQFGPSGTTTVTKWYYLQKKDSTVVDRLNRDTFLEYVSDSEEATNKANAHYIWHYTSYAPFAGFAVGAVYLIKAVGSDHGTGNYTAPISLVLGSFLSYGIITTIADHKLHKAIEIYNAEE